MIENRIYYDNLTRDYGHNETVEDKSQRFKSDFKFEELSVGMEVLNVVANTESTILQLKSGELSNIIEVFNRTNRKNVSSEGKRKGIDSTNWYLIEDFNRTFRRIKK